MKLLRRRVRRSFLFAAIGFLVIGITDCTHEDFAARGITAFQHYSNIALCLAQGALYLVAFMATRTVSSYRSNTATGASLVTLIYSICDLWQHHADIFDARRGLILFLIAAAGLYVFAQGGAPAKDSLAKEEQPVAAGTTPPSASSVRTDQAINNAPPQPVFTPPAERVMRVYKISADKIVNSGPQPTSGSEPLDANYGGSAPVSASFPAFAAAAAAPAAPAAPSWDPLSFIRDGSPKKSGA